MNAKDRNPVEGKKNGADRKSDQKHGRSPDLRTRDQRVKKLPKEPEGQQGTNHPGRGGC